MENYEEVAEEIEYIYNRICDTLGIGSRPHGDMWIKLVILTMSNIVAAGLVQHLNKQVEEILIDDNFHTAASAVSTLIELQKYAGYE